MHYTEVFRGVANNREECKIIMNVYFNAWIPFKSDSILIIVVFIMQNTIEINFI